MIGIDRNVGSARPLLRHGRNRLFTVLSLSNLVVGTGKHIANNLAIIRLLLHHQNALAHTGST
jgi:hypothetical protein